MPSKRKLAQQQAQNRKKLGFTGPVPIGKCVCGTQFFAKYERKTHTCRAAQRQQLAAE